MKQLLVSFFFTLLLLSSVSYAQHHDNKGHVKTNGADQKEITDSTKATRVDVSSEAWNTVCPVMGNRVKSTAPKVMYHGKVYGFCCAGCDEKFEKNPEKYAKNLNEAGNRFIGKK